MPNRPKGPAPRAPLQAAALAYCSALTATAAGTVLLFLSLEIPYALVQLMIGR